MDSITIVIIIACSTLLFIIMVLCFIRYLQIKYKLKIYDDGALRRDQLAYSRVLEQLPVHRHLIVNYSSIASAVSIDGSAATKERVKPVDTNLLDLIERNLDSVPKLDYKQRSVIDLLLEYYPHLDSNIAFDALVSVLEVSLPVVVNEEGEVVPVDRAIHCHAWTKVVRSEHRLEAVVDHLLLGHSSMCSALADALDEDGRKAIDVASAECKSAFNRYLFFLLRYDQFKVRNQCDRYCTYTALDRQSTDGSGGLVSLKFFLNKRMFSSELHALTQLSSADHLHVQPKLRHLDADCDWDYRTYLDRFMNSDCFKHLIVFPLEQCHLGEYMDKVSITTDLIRQLVVRIASCLQYVHSKGYVFGNLKPSNIVFLHGQWMLTNLCTAAPINSAPQIPLQNAAYAPPEMVYQRFVKVSDKISICYGMFYSDADVEMRPNELVNESPTMDVSYDLWSLGMLLYYLCHYKTCFHCDKYDNIADEDSYRKLFGFSIGFKQSLLSSVTDQQLRNLLSRLLNKDPARRLPLRQVLLHPFVLDLDHQVQTSAGASGSEDRATHCRSEEDPYRYDVYLCYRQSSDLELSRSIHRTLTALGLQVWFDESIVHIGNSFEQAYVEGLQRSKVFMPVLSRGAINDDSFFHGSNSFSRLRSDSPIDRLLLEMRMAIELKARHSLLAICPILIGDFNAVQGTYGHYIHSNCHPSLDRSIPVLVSAMEDRVLVDLEVHGLGLPMLTGAGECCVAAVLQAVTGSFSEVIEGTADQSRCCPEGHLPSVLELIAAHITATMKALPEVVYT